MRWYISGPMTGRPNLNRSAFEYAKKLFKDSVTPFDIFNPGNKCKGADWCNALVTDLGTLEKCDAIYMLAGWEKSPGAAREYELANKLGLVMNYERPHNGMDLDEVISDVLTFVSWIDAEGWLSVSMSRIGSEIRDIISGYGLPDECIAWMERSHE